MVQAKNLIFGRRMPQASRTEMPPPRDYIFFFNEECDIEGQTRLWSYLHYERITYQTKIKKSTIGEQKIWATKKHETELKPVMEQNIGFELIAHDNLRMCQLLVTFMKKCKSNLFVLPIKDDNYSPLTHM